MENDPIVTDGQIDEPADNDPLLDALIGDDEPDDPGSETPDEGGDEPVKVERFKVKIDGVEREVSKDDLIAHYQKQEAAEKRFQEAAAIRKEAETQRTQYQQHQQQLQQAIDHFEAQAQMFANEGMPTPEQMQQLLEESPHEYLKLQQKLQQRQQAMQQAQAARAYLQQQQAETTQQQTAEYLAQESQRLVNEYLPEWKDKTVRERDEKELVTFLTNKGYSQQDLINLSQSRASNIALALNAMKYEQLLAKAKGVKKAKPEQQAAETAEIKPLPTVGAKAAAKPFKSILDDKLSDDEWFKLRNKQKARS